MSSSADSKDFPNFYENIKEANLRLKNTIVLYDGYPYHIITIAGGKPDGIFRVYMEPIGQLEGGVFDHHVPLPHDALDDVRGAMMDEWMHNNKDQVVIRKMMNSPLFNKFRPFPLGMCNTQGCVLYLERQPQRHTHQGMTQNMLCVEEVSINKGNFPRSRKDSVTVHSPAFRDTVQGIYPSFQDCVKNLLDPNIANEAVGFHREFALVRGPVNTLFLAYKGDLVGVLPYGDTKLIRISNEHRHTKEVVENLNLFEDIIVN